MQKSGVKTRDIRFFSEKNDTMICVHTPLARDYAKWLEDQPWVERYETGVLLDASQMDHVSRVDIRSNYFETVWESDFMLIHADGRKEIREIISAEQLRKRAIVTELTRQAAIRLSLRISLLVRRIGPMAAVIERRPAIWRNIRDCLYCSLIHRSECRLLPV